MKIAERIEDMSAIGILRILHDDDGDILVSVTEEEIPGVLGASACVEFCLPGSGGGHSPRTHAALRALLEAMEADNAGRPE